MKRPANHLLTTAPQAEASRALKVFQLAQLRLGLELELKGIPFARRGPSASALTRRLFGLQGEPAELLRGVDTLLRALRPARVGHVPVPPAQAVGVEG